MKKPIIGILIAMGVLLILPIAGCIYHMTPAFHPASVITESFADLAAMVQDRCCLPTLDLLPTTSDRQSFSVYHRNSFTDDVSGYYIYLQNDNETVSITCQSTKVYKEDYPLSNPTDTYRDILLHRAKSADGQFYSYAFYLGEFRYICQANDSNTVAALSHSIIDDHFKS